MFNGWQRHLVTWSCTCIWGKIKDTFNFYIKVKNKNFQMQVFFSYLSHVETIILFKTASFMNMSVVYEEDSSFIWTNWNLLNKYDLKQMYVFLIRWSLCNRIMWSSASDARLSSNEVNMDVTVWGHEESQSLVSVLWCDLTPERNSNNVYTNNFYANCQLVDSKLFWELQKFRDIWYNSVII